MQYKFKSQTAVHTVQFDGPSIKLADLKSEIIRATGINKDFWSNTDLEISNAQTGEVFSADAQVDRNVAVLVRRVPAQRRAPIKSQVLQRELSTEDDELGVDATGLRPLAASSKLAASEPLVAEETKVAARTAGRYASKLICPLTGTIFEDAVITTCCGTSFSQEPLARTLKMRGACPECNTEASKVRTLPNRLLREAVAAARRPPAADASVSVAPAAAASVLAESSGSDHRPLAGIGHVKVEGGDALAGSDANRKRPREGSEAVPVVKSEDGQASQRHRPA